MSNVDIGEDLSFYTPLTHDGNVEAGTLGCYPGDAADLNIVGPEPGFHYKWERLDDTAIAAAQRKGWDVDESQPERKVVVRNMRYSNIGYARATIRGDTILMKIPEAIYRQLQADEEEAAAARRQDPANSYTNNATMLSMQERYRQGLRGPLTFRYPNHRFEALNHNPAGN